MAARSKQNPNLTGTPPKAIATPANELPLAAMKVPAGFKVETFVSGLANARMMYMSPKGTLFVSTLRLGRVYAVKDPFGKKEVVTIAQGLTMPNGIAMKDGNLIVVREAARAYLSYRLFGVTSMAATFAFKAFFDGIGRTHVHLVSAVVMNALNIALCWVFIFGNAGAPAMGAAGAGLAGVVSTYVGLAIMVAYALLPEFRRYEPFAWRRVSRSTISDILKLSVPSAVATIAVMSGFGLFVAIVSKLDAEIVALEPGVRSVQNDLTVAEPPVPGE